MKVTRAKCAGACYGVQRALNMALDTVSKGSRAVTLGPLIHNPQVVAQLAERGIRAVESPEQAVEGSVIIRSHGVTPQVRREIEARGLPVVDATCPHVARAQKAAAKLARECGHVVVVGEAGHPEVEGLVAYAREAGGEVLVAGRETDVPAGLSGKVGVVVQTTQTREAFEEVLAALRDRGVECVVKDTVCLATRERQESAADLAREVDAMIVIGGRNSSNTTRLAEICSSVCGNTHHIERASELDPAWFDQCTEVGITAGASTPEDQIAAVEARIASLG